MWLFSIKENCGSATPLGMEGERWQNFPLFIMLMGLSIMFTYSCNSPKEGSTADASKDYLIKNEIIVELEPGITTEQIEATFEPYELKMKKAISQVMKLWLFTYDTALIEPDKMLEALKENPGVKQAEYNKKLTGRRGG